MCTRSYQQDSNYQPPSEKIAEAHKAARFVVGALAFDDIFVAVDYLKKSFELLTNPVFELAMILGHCESFTLAYHFVYTFCYVFA
ncbi:homolog of mammalian LYST-interacting protein 5-like protein [Tanacetum coccineum]|uniref:Homolog of mammalian LYST-interacting protein 5-like protein n=1 Tax=Tanacetum coccineum TaxID=301880 RepID=A0ABQ4ZZE3_9ASTR